MVADRLQEAKARQVYLVLRDRIMSGALWLWRAASHRKRPCIGAWRIARHGAPRSRRASARTFDRAAAQRRNARRLSRAFVADERRHFRRAGEPRRDGPQHRVRLLSFGYVPAGGPAAEALGRGDHELLQRSVRVRFGRRLAVFLSAGACARAHRRPHSRLRNWPIGRCLNCWSDRASRSSARPSGFPPALPRPMWRARWG